MHMCITATANVNIALGRNQWCNGKFSLVGTLAWHYGHIPYRCPEGGVFE